MSLTLRTRLAFAALIMAGFGVLAALPAPASAAGSLALVPDLTTIQPHSFSGDGWIRLRTNKRGVAALRISNRIANEGTGPLELRAGEASQECDERGEYPGGADLQADQRIYEDSNGNGYFDRNIDLNSSDAQAGCFEFHPKHGHWHFQEFSQYELRDLKTGEVMAGPSRKIGFCIVDGDRALPALPGSPPNGRYPLAGGCGADGTGPGVMGLSVGWADSYGWSTPGQRLSVAAVPAGPYCLVATANPISGEPDEPQIIESDETNNARRVAIAIKPEKKRVRTLTRACPAV